MHHFLKKEGILEVLTLVDQEEDLRKRKDYIEGKD